jgi:predicted MFS family arabinose efflux permease
VLSASGGALADWLGWTPFFLISTGACLPSLVLLLWLMRQAARAQP